MSCHNEPSLKIAPPSLTAVNLDQPIDDQHYRILLEHIPNTQRQAVTKFHSKALRDRSLLGTCLIRYCISQWVSIPFRNVLIEKNVYGKPYLPEFPKLHFNVTYSGNWAVFILSEHAVGIDVEQVREIDIESVMSLFSESEQRWLASKGHNDKLDAFYDLWTLKESYVKAIGKGLSIPLHSFTIHTDPSIALNAATGDEQEWIFKRYNLVPGYKLSVCSANPQLPGAVTAVSSSNFISKVLHSLQLDMNSCKL